MKRVVHIPVIFEDFHMLCVLETNIRYLGGSIIWSHLQRYMMCFMAA